MRLFGFLDRPPPLWMAPMLVPATLAILFLLAPGSGNLVRLLSARWDSEHYADIIEHGYWSTLPSDADLRTMNTDTVRFGSNAAFFPGYPLAGKGVQWLTGFPPALALWTVALLSACGYWTVLLLLFQQWKIAPVDQWMTLGLLFSFPSAFFLTAAYAEALSMFLCVLLLWSHERKNAAPSLLYAFALTFTRAPLLPVAFFPLARSCVTRRSMARSSLVACAGAAGILAFVAYCAVRFGQPFLYVHLQRAGWSIAFDPLFLLHDPLRILFAVGTNHVDPLHVGHLAAALGFWLLLVCTVVLVRRRTNPTVDVPLALSLLCIAAALWVVAVGSTVGVQMRSVIRYLYPAWFFLMLCIAVLRPSRRVRMTGGLLAGVLGVVQIVLASAYLSGTFVG